MRIKIASIIAISLAVAQPASAGQETLFESWEDCMVAVSAIDMNAWTATCAPKAGGWVIAWAKKRKR